MFIAGIVLLGIVALALAIFFFFVHKRQLRMAAQREREREVRRRRAEERRAREALEAELRAAAIPVKSVVPIFIMQPDGRLILAAHTAFNTFGKGEGDEHGAGEGCEPSCQRPCLAHTP